MKPSDAGATGAERAVRTARFRMSHAAFAKEMLRRRGRRPFVVLLALMALLGAAALIWSSLEMLVLLLMILFLIAPMVAAYLYYSYGTRFECAMNVAEHDVCLSPGEALLRLYLPQPEAAGGEEAENQAAESRVVERRLTLTPGCGWLVRRDAVSLTLPGGGFIWLPYSSFDSADDFRLALDFVRNERT